MSKKDPRVLKTDRALTSAVNRLFPKHSWQDISISMVCKEAQVSRSTFYAHFDNKDALLERLFELVELNILEISVVGRGIDVNGSFCFVPIILEDMQKRKSVVPRQQNDIHSFQLMLRYLKLLANLVKVEIGQSSRSAALENRNIKIISLALAAEIKIWVDEDCREPIEMVLRKFDKFTRDFLFK